MANKVCIYKEEYKPNKIYYDTHRTALALMRLDDGSLVVGKGTNMPVAFSSMVGAADNEVEPLRRLFLNETNRFKETIRFETFTDLQRFLWGTKEAIREDAVLLDFPKKIYVGSNKWGLVYCAVNTNVEVPEGYIYVYYYEAIYNDDLVKIPVIDSWVGSKLSLEEFNELYKEYNGEFTYAAEIDYAKRNENETKAKNANKPSLSAEEKIELIKYIIEEKTYPDADDCDYNMSNGVCELARQIDDICEVIGLKRYWS